MLHPDELKRRENAREKQERKEMGDKVKSILLHIADYRVEGVEPNLHVYLDGKGDALTFKTEAEAVDHILDIAVDMIVDKVYRFYI